MSLPTIASLWIGGNLSYLEQLCLKSFLDHGHRVILYTYAGEVGNAPKGVEVLDAAAIYPGDEIIRHKDTGSPAFHADAFRYRMLEVQNVIWVDADVLCMRPWDFKDQFVFGWEKPGKLICNAVLGLPRFSRTLERLNKFCRDEYPIPPWANDDERTTLEAAKKAGNPVHVTELKWGVWGPSALTHFLHETKEVDRCLPQEAFYPISFKDRRDLLDPGMHVDDQLGDGCYGVHLWNRRVSRRIITHEGGVPDPASFLGRAMIRHKIDPRLAPIPDRPPPGHETEPMDNTITDKARADAIAEAAGGDMTPPATTMMQTASGVMERMKCQHSRPYQRAIDDLEGRTGTLAGGLPDIKEPISHDKITILTSMKNEGPFIVEWIAYHLSIGATHFLVYTNDCADNTNDILNRLQDLGYVTRIDNPWNKDSTQKPQHVALKDAESQPCVTEADWVLTIDVDEFVNIHVGDGTFADLFKASNDPNVVSFTWKFFGCGGVYGYEDRPVIEQFTRCAPEFIPKPRLGWGFKSMVHRTAPYTKIGVHRPLKIDDEANVDKVRWVNGSGRAMPEMLLTNNGWRSTKRSLGYQMATLNHYVLRSAESFLVKRDRGRVNHTEQDQGIDYWVRRNYATETDDRMHARLPAMEQIREKLMADDILAAEHQKAVDWHRGKVQSLRADPGYEQLYQRIAEQPHPDALYLTKPETEEEAATDIGVAIPEPETNLMTEEQQAARVEELLAMLHGKPLPEPQAFSVAPTSPAETAGTGRTSHLPKVKAAPKPKSKAPATNMTASKTTAAQAPVKQTNVTAPTAMPAPEIAPEEALPIIGPFTPPASGESKGDARFTDARAYVAQTQGAFFWDGPENAFMFTPGSRRLVVSFDNLSVVKTDEQRWPWGQSFLHGKLGVSVLGVMATQRNWFRHDFVHDAFDILRAQGFFQAFDEVLFYGASMGGFAALTYARCAPGAKVLAIAPQSTLDRRILPDEDRWRWTTKLNWNGRYADAAVPEALHEASDVVVISDPYFAPDAAQVARLSGPTLRKLRMPFFGHQLPNAFLNMGNLKTLLEGVLNGTMSTPDFYRMMRARRDLPRFQHDILMEAERRDHPKLALQVCEYTLKKRDAGNIRRSRDRIRADLGMAPVVEG